MNNFPFAAMAVVKERFGNILGRDADFLTFIQVGDTTVGDRFRNGFLDLVAKPAYNFCRLTALLFLPLRRLSMMRAFIAIASGCLPYA